MSVQGMGIYDKFLEKMSFVVDLMHLNSFQEDFFLF